MAEALIREMSSSDESDPTTSLNKENVVKNPEMPSDRFYRIGQEIDIDEDHTHEFKGHRSFTIGNIRPIARELRSMQPVSKSINAMLNTGDGGTIYLGIRDDGIIDGFQMTVFQRDHVRLSLDELLPKYTPVVPPEMVELLFVRALADGEEHYMLDTREECRHPIRYNAHSLGRPRRCWCDEEALERKDENIPRFVIEIRVRPWNPNGEYERRSPLVSTVTRLHPIFQDEYGMVYWRYHASNCALTMQEIMERTRDEFKIYHMDNK